MDTYADYTNIYDYSMDGTKIRHEVWDGSDYHYRGSLVYNNGAFESASFGGGRIVGTNNGANSEVHYFLTDHLGSTRVVAKVTSTGMVDLDRKDYYPFGKAWKQAGLPTSDNRYLFSGKERSNICLEDDYSSIIPLYDFGRRNYYPDGVFFLQQDPLLEKYYSIGQYNYCAGNPIKFADHDGRKIVDAKGNVAWKNGAPTKYATPDIIRAGEAMGLTSTGKSLWNSMSESSVSVNISISSEVYYNERGNLTLGTMDPRAEIKKITIYEGSINKLVDPTTKVKGADNKLRQALYQNAETEERIGATVSHEGYHALDNEPTNREERAVSAEKAYMKDAERSKPIVSDDKLKKVDNNLFN